MHVTCPKNGDKILFCEEKENHGQAYAEDIHFSESLHGGSF